MGGGDESGLLKVEIPIAPAIRFPSVHWGVLFELLGHLASSQLGISALDVCDRKMLTSTE